MSKKKNSIKDEYDKIRIYGYSNGYGKNRNTGIHISLREIGYVDSTVADVGFNIKEAKKIIVLIENAIKEATKKEDK